MSPRRVLHLVGTSDVGGTERFLVSLASGLRARGWESGICVLGAPGRLADAYARAASGTWHLHAGERGPAQVVLDWQAAVREFQPEVSVLYGFRANLIGRLSTGRVPLVNALRSIYVDEQGSALARRLDRLTFGRVRLCIANSQEAIRRHVAAGFPAGRFRWIPNGIDVTRFRAVDRAAARRHFGLEPGERLVVSVANLKPVKNHPLLLRASRALRDRGLAHRLWIVGEGPERASLEALARELGLPGPVCVGPTADPVPYLAAADAFALASRYEGTPTAIIEAMAAGVPVVATAVGDTAALCAGGAGLVVPSEDLDALVAALRVALEDEPARQAMVAAGRQAASRFTIEAMVARYAEAFAEVSAGGPAGATP